MCRLFTTAQIAEIDPAAEDTAERPNIGNYTTLMEAYKHTLELTASKSLPPIKCSYILSPPTYIKVSQLLMMIHIESLGTIQVVMALWSDDGMSSRQSSFLFLC